MSCKHNLIEILRADGYYGYVDKIVRWCDKCGGVVVDTEYDCRTQPGALMKMRFPLAAKDPIAFKDYLSSK